MTKKQKNPNKLWTPVSTNKVINSIQSAYSFIQLRSVFEFLLSVCLGYLIIFVIYQIPLTNNNNKVPPSLNRFTFEFRVLKGEWFLAYNKHLNIATAAVILAFVFLCLLNINRNLRLLLLLLLWWMRPLALALLLLLDHHHRHCNSR